MKAYKVAYQGIEGAYSEAAIYEFAKKNNLEFEGIPRKNFRELFEAISNDVKLGFVPIENSNAGSVSQCYDLFLEYDVEIIAELAFIVNHCLMGIKGAKVSEITNVFSHPQALAQCSSFLEANNIEPVGYADTASASKYIAEEGNNTWGAIGSKICASKYGLEILKENFQNSNDNITRFFLVKKKGVKFDFEKQLKDKDKTTLIFQTKDIPASLYKALGGFATNGVNLTKIESRPSKLENFNYIFYLDLDGSLLDENVMLALDELKFFSKKVIILGSYPKD